MLSQLNDMLISFCMSASSSVCDSIASPQGDQYSVELQTS